MFCEEPAFSVGIMMVFAACLAILAVIGAYKFIRYIVSGDIINDARDIESPFTWDWVMILTVLGCIVGAFALICGIGAGVKWLTCP